MSKVISGDKYRITVLTDRLLRLSVGLEGIGDLICEFNRVFAIAEKETADR